MDFISLVRSLVTGRRVLAALVVVLLPARTDAYTLRPSLLFLRPVGEESSAFVHLENKGVKPVALEITIQEHRKDIDGKAIAGKEASDDFLIYPAQIVMLPGDETSAQIRWIGDPALAIERAYTVVTREVRIPRTAAATPEPERNEGVRIDVTVLTNYEVRIYVTPKGAKPKVVVESVADSASPPDAAANGPAKTAGSDSPIEIMVANRGTAHVVLAGAFLILQAVGPTGEPLRQPSVVVPAKDIPALKTHLLAGDRRRLSLPRPASLPAGPIRVTVAVAE